jgi:hypothetical protein
VTEAPDFSGKILSIYLVNAAPEERACVLLEQAQFERQGDRLFLVGRVPDMKQNGWARGLRAAIAWDSIGYYLLFDSHEEVVRRTDEPTSGVGRFFTAWRK